MYFLFWWKCEIFQTADFPSKIKQNQALTNGTWSSFSALLFDFHGIVFWRAKQMQRVDCFLNLVRKKKKLAKHGKGLAGEEEGLIINEDYQPTICEPRHTK